MALAKDKKVLVVFYAEWCPPCKALGAVLEQLSSDRELDTQIVKVNIDNEPELASKYQVISVPTLILINDGMVIKTELGFKSKEALKKFIEN